MSQITKQQQKVAAEKKEKKQQQKAAAAAAAPAEGAVTTKDPKKAVSKEPKKKKREEIPEHPKYVVRKAKFPSYNYTDNVPERGYAWYLVEPKQMTAEEMEAELDIPGRRWFAQDKPTFELLQKHNCVMARGTGLEDWGVLNMLGNPMFWVGRRVEPPKAAEVHLVLSTAELQLKSEFHQHRLFDQLIMNVQRITENKGGIVRAGAGVEIRGKMPTKEQIDLLCLVPGIGKIYKPLPENRFGQCLHVGANGNPILSDQKVLCLLSGGIDSPVAAYQMMTRGCTVHAVHFLNSTSDTAKVIDKNRKIGMRLSEIQGLFVLHFVDIGPLQSQIVANVPNHNRTLIYKWFMLSLAAGLDSVYRHIVTGDSLGQVASQTYNNLATLYPTINKSILSPLIGMNKTDIVAIARKIGTFNESIVEACDACQYMMCKSGANVNIGPRTLRNLVAKIAISELPIVTERYDSGKMIGEPVKQTFLPNVGARKVEVEPQVKPQPPVGGEKVRPVFFDAGAGTAPDPAVLAAIVSAPHGNPNSLHQSGRVARMAIEKIRAELAGIIGKPSKDIVFTSGGTEANNIALAGYKVARDAWSHPSTSGSEKPTKQQTVKVVDLVNHETGSIATDLTRPKQGRLHVDACQALCKIDFRELDLSQVDSMSFSAHKINGPQGVGAVYIRDLDASPLFFGGSQESGIRPGTENVPGIVGFGAALQIDRTASAHKEVEKYLVAELAALGCVINKRGPTSGFIVHATLPEGFDNVSVVSQMSAAHNVEIGTGSACKTHDSENVTVYETLGISPPPKRRSIRMSYDFNVTMEDAKSAISALAQCLGRKRPQHHVDPTGEAQPKE